MLNEQIIAKIEAIPVPKMKSAVWLGIPRRVLTIFVDKDIMEMFISPYCTKYSSEGKDEYLFHFDERYNFDEFVTYINAITDVIAKSTKKEDNAPKKKSNVGIHYEYPSSKSMIVDCPEEYISLLKKLGVVQL